MTSAPLLQFLTQREKLPCATLRRVVVVRKTCSRLWDDKVPKGRLSSGPFIMNKVRIYNVSLLLFNDQAGYLLSCAE